jgi:hypothetical protein
MSVDISVHQSAHEKMMDRLGMALGLFVGACILVGVVAFTIWYTNADQDAKATCRDQGGFVVVAGGANAPTDWTCEDHP